MEEPGSRSAASGRGRSVAARADLIIFNDFRYRGTSLRTHPPYDRMGRIPESRLREIGLAVRVRGRCARSPHGLAAESVPGDTVRVASIDGVSPDIAIAGLPLGNVYLREGATMPSELASASWTQ